MIERLYEQELRYLYEAGREFAKARPEQARFLNIDAVGDRDPYVERLFEGFAFLTARVRELLDSSYPDLSQTLVNQLWPHLLREIPSATILELRPRPGLLQQTRVLEPGAEVLSAPLGPDATTCRFTTTQAVRLNPISLTRAEQTRDQSGAESLVLTLRPAPGIRWSDVSLAPVRLFCHGEFADAVRLHTHLTSHVVAARVEADDGAFCAALDPSSAVTPAGLAAEESILPHDARSLWAYTLLLEYFAYPEKFLFADLWGLDRLSSLEHPPGQITYTLTFDRPLPGQRRVSAEHLRLHCTPAVNLFVRDAEPVAADGTRSEYRVTADAARPGTVLPHSVVSVTGVDRATGQRRAYLPLSAFARADGSTAACYEAHYRESPDSGRALYLLFGGERLNDGEARAENVSIAVRCTNGVLPREEIREGGLNRPGPGLPDFLAVGNITRPSLPRRPPAAGDTHWVFLSHLCATCGSLARADRLRALLRAYDWSGDEAWRKRTEAVAEATIAPHSRVAGGAVVRGSRFVVTVDEAQYGDTGDLELFGRVLNAFLSHYAGINEELVLEIVLKPSGRRLGFGPSGGERCPA